MMGSDKTVVLLHHLANIFFRELDAMNSEMLGESVTGQNMLVIGYLACHKEDVYQKDLENHFCVRRSTISKVLRLMQEKGMIQREGVREDARLKKITLTEKGWKIYHLAADNIEILNKRLYQNISEEEKTVFLDILKKMKSNMGCCKENME